MIFPHLKSLHITNKEVNINILFNRTVYCKGKHLDKVGLLQTEQEKRYEKEEIPSSKEEQEVLWGRPQVCKQSEKDLMDERKNLYFVYISSIFSSWQSNYITLTEKRKTFFFFLMTRKKNVKGYFRVRYI